MLKTQGFLYCLRIEIMVGTLKPRRERAHKVLISSFYFKGAGSSRKMELLRIEFRSYVFMLNI